MRAVLQHLGFNDRQGLEVHHQGDLPARSGMGSSSAFAVGLIKALLGLREELVGSEKLATLAICIEQTILAENVGCQDQVATAYGGLNRIHFLQNGAFRVEPIILPSIRLDTLQAPRLMLFYTGTSRIASEIAGDLISKVKTNSDRLHRIRKMVDDAVDLLTDKSRSLDDFGRLLHEAWMEKRELSAQISNSTIDDIYSTARKAGGPGGKLMGAGSSGFMFFYVPQECQDAVRNALHELLHVPFRFESEGSTIIHYRPND